MPQHGRPPGNVTNRHGATILDKFFALITVLLVWLPALNLIAQNEVVERVQVTNREVVVRVFRGKDPVTGLTEKDFTLYENGRRLPITSLRELHRSLMPLPAPPQLEVETGVLPRRGRLFLFLLWWNEASHEWPKAWEFFRSHIFRPGDRVIISDGKRTVEIRDLEQQEQKLAEFFVHVNRNLERRKMDKVHLVRELDRSAQELHDSLTGLRMRSAERPLLAEFESRYRGALDEYRLSRLKAQPGLLAGLADQLRSLEAEKWVLVFLQNERVPMVHKQSRLFRAPMSQQTASRLGKFIDECSQRMIMATDMAVHVRDLRSLFTGANATFHLFLSDPQGEILDTDQLRWYGVFSSWESAFRDISRDTGGAIENTTKLAQAMERSARRQDTFYALTYRPAAEIPTRAKLRVELNRPGLDVVYARRLENREIQPFLISSPQWKDGKLEFSLSGYLRETGSDGNLYGNLSVRVSTTAPDGNSLDFTHTLRPAGDSATVTMKVNFPAPGNYLLNLESRDEIFGQTAHGHIGVQIDPPPPAPTEASASATEQMSPQLEVTLEKTADYCRNLKTAAFRFYCTEEVSETELERNRLTRRWDRHTRHWNYDYQVVGEGTIQEQRRLINGKEKGLEKENAVLKTRFHSRYSVFMPVTLLAVENRPKYRYQLVDTDRIRKRPCAVVEVIPRSQAGDTLTQGLAWIDIDNGSVLKIEVYPSGIQGSEALEATARKLGARLELKATHWYLEERRGLRFPSETEFSESYIYEQYPETRMRPVSEAGKWSTRSYMRRSTERVTRRIEFYHLRHQYSDYRYFEVKSHLEVE